MKSNTTHVDANDNWAQVELFRWQYGTLPKSGDDRRLSVPKGLRGMADAIEAGDKDNFPTPLNVVSVLRYAADLISRGQPKELGTETRRSRKRRRRR